MSLLCIDQTFLFCALPLSPFLWFGAKMYMLVISFNRHTQGKGNAIYSFKVCHCVFLGKKDLWLLLNHAYNLREKLSLATRGRDVEACYLLIRLEDAGCEAERRHETEQREAKHVFQVSGAGRSVRCMKDDWRLYAGKQIQWIYFGRKIAWCNLCQ